MAKKAKFEYVKGLTSDIAFKAYGKDKKEMFESAAFALFSIICKIDKIQDKKKIILTVSGDNYEDLLFNWLQELVATVDTEELFLHKFKILKITKTSLKAECFGEEISPQKGNTLVKAITNYLFNIEQIKNKKGKITSEVATVSVDI